MPTEEKQLRLYDIPRRSIIFTDLSDGSKFLTFGHLDGMYSYCRTEKGNVIHLSGGTPLEPCEGGYKIVSHETP